MYYKEYGNTGIKVSAVGFGGMRFNEEDVKAGRFEKCAEIPVYAFEKGIGVYNATRGGQLEVFERVDIDELLA